ncbi:MAG: phosphatidylserine/phosphatidylglycerophosphate/cardiolipin synthase family protein [Deltaproteobacteria bacterium]|nr:phosphatidylserine/phosphatidylglycerophosphate/cardiolipin synthase family protein [Deltaproteobacteria bacterium]
MDTSLTAFDGHAGFAMADPVAGRRRLKLLDSGRAAFREVVRCIDAANHSIEARTFLWRDDEIGNEIGRAVLRAAERGVQVIIHKDAVAAVYEYMAGTRQSFFHKELDGIQKFQTWFMGKVYTRADKVDPRPNPISQALLDHSNVQVLADKRFDHAKLFVFDDERLVLGSMGIGDAHHSEWVEKAVRIDGAEHVARLRDRLSGVVPFDGGRKVDFLFHSREMHPPRTCPMLTERLGLIDSTEKSLTIEMAYLGDRRFTSAVIRAVKRGVDVKLVTAAQADVLGNLNRATCDRILRRTKAPSNLTIVMLPRMVHAKVVVRDGRYIDIGSANFTPLSHGVYDELNAHLDDDTLAVELESAIERHCEEGETVGRRVRHRKLHYQIERAIVAYQGRRSPRRGYPSR